MKFVLAVTCLMLSLSASAQWSYRATDDQMRGTKTKIAELKSVNRAQLRFPYHGGSKLQLIARKSSDEDMSVILWIDRGQIPCHFGCRLPAKFDDEEVREWNLTGAASGRSDTLFIDDAEGFVDKLKVAKKLVVEVEIYDYGRFQFKYNPKGLKWE